MAQSDTIIKGTIKEDIGVEPVQLTDAEADEQTKDLNKLFLISQVRESPHIQFDGMPYMKYNETNEMADMSYIAPKKNKYDTRVTSGITHEKDSSILALVQNFNFEAQVTVYHKDQELPELSTSFSDAIRKARELCNYDEKRPINYRQLIVQGTAFAEVKRVTQWVPNKVITDKNADYTSKGGIKFVEMGKKKIFDATDINLVDGKKVFLEDIYQQDIRKQNTYTCEYIPREIVETVWGNNPRWANVPKQCGGPGDLSAGITQGSIYSDWFFFPLDQNKLEVIQVQKPFENRYQIYINRVPMLECGFPLTAISPSGLPFLAKGDIDPMNMFAYSKGVPAKTKMDQALYDALLRIGVINFEQATFPPIGNNTGKLLSPDLFMPTKQTRGITKEQISILNENAGMTPSQFQFIDMIKEQIDNKSITALLENGGQPEGEMTLGQYLDSQKRQLIKLGGIFDGVINWEKQISHLMLMDFLTNSTVPDTSMAVKSSFENGNKGLRVMRFKKKNTATSDQLHQEELDMQQKTGQDIRYTDLNPDQLKAMVGNPDYYFYYEIIPVDKNNDKVTQAFFVQMIMQAQQLFGMDSLKVQSLKQRYAQVMGEKFDDLFLSQDEIQMQQQQAAAAAAVQGTPPVGGGGNKAVAPGISVPSPQAGAQPAKMFT